ncbi:ABC transporter permease [Aerococcaceae bacterium WGS1372]
MKVFKLFYKLLRANISSILLYFFLLLGIIIPVNLQFEERLNETFEVQESIMTIFNHDDVHPLSNYLIDYLKQNAEIVEIEEDDEALADAFFDDSIQYALTIPEGFGERLISHYQDPLPLERQVVNSEIDGANIDTILNTFITNTRLLASNLPAEYSEDQLNQLLDTLATTLNIKVKILPIATNEGLSEITAFGEFYTHYMSYILMTTFVTVFGYAIISMRQPDVVKRNRMSTMTEGQHLRQTLLGTFSFSILYWILLISVAVFIYGVENIFSQKGILLIISSFIATIGIQAMAYFIVTVAPNKGMITFLSTFISLFLAFASGLFAPREFIADVMQKIATIATPIWQVQADEIILSSNTLSDQHISQILMFFGIEILISLAYFAASFVIQKYRQKNSIYMG